MQELRVAILDRMRLNALKITKQREALVDLLLVDRDNYENISALDEKMRQQFPSMSHDTIYRNIKSLAKAGIVEENNKLGNTSVKIVCDFTHHHHFICDNCGKVIELKECPMDFYNAQIPGAKVTSHQFVLHGLCAECAAKIQA